MVKNGAAGMNSRYLGRFCGGLLLLSGLLTLTGFGGQYHWLLDLTSHFRLQLFLAQVAVLAVALFLRRPAVVGVAVLLAGLNFAQIAPFYRAPRETPAAKATDVTLQMLQMNLFELNTNRNAVAAYVRQVQPDILTLNEYTMRWHRDLAKTGVLKQFPYQVSNSELGLYSRLPIHAHTILDLEGQTTLVARLSPGGQPLTLFVTHTPVPLSGALFAYQLKQLRQIAVLARHSTDRVILIGDLNTTPWSYSFRRFQAESGLQDTAQGFGIEPTWPSFLWLPWLPLDNCLVSTGIVTRKRWVGPFNGSDHYPLGLVLQFTPGALPAVEATSAGVRHSMQ